MKIFKNFLDENLLSLILKEFDFKKDKAVWTPSSQMWPEHLTKNTFGDCMVSPLQPDLLDKVEKSIKNVVDKDYGRLGVSMHVWRPGSSINLHDDGMYTFGATIYLNKDWKISDGGILLWKNKQDEDEVSWNAVIPTYNTLVVNDSTDLHFTTPVNIFSKESKISIQIFGI